MPSIFLRNPAKIPSSKIPVDPIHKNVVGIEQIDALYRFAVMLTSNDAEAEWLVYQTYLRTVQGMDGLRGDDSLKSGLLNTLRNLWLNEIQRRRDTSQIGIIDGLATDERDAFSKNPVHIRDIEGAGKLDALAFAVTSSTNDSTKQDVIDSKVNNYVVESRAEGQTETMGIEYIDGLYRYAMALSRNHAEAEDQMQKTYSRAMQAMRRLRADSNIKGWLFTILRKIWLNQLRKRCSGPQMLEIDVGAGADNNILEPSNDSHDVYVSKLEAEHVRAAIHELPAEFREIILLREYEDLSYREIAGVLRCPIGTVMSRLARARAKLRTLLTGVAISKGSLSQ